MSEEDYTLHCTKCGKDEAGHVQREELHWKDDRVPEYAWDDGWQRVVKVDDDNWDGICAACWEKLPWAELNDDDFDIMPTKEIKARLMSLVDATVTLRKDGQEIATGELSGCSLEDFSVNVFGWKEDYRAFVPFYVEDVRGNTMYEGDKYPVIEIED